MKDILILVLLSALIILAICLIVSTIISIIDDHKESRKRRQDIVSFKDGIWKTMPNYQNK